MSDSPTVATPATPPAAGNSEEAVVASFARLLAAEDASEATPSATDEPDAETPASPPDAEAEEPAEAEESSDESESSDEDEEQAQEPVYTVKVDGKSQQVTLTELLKGYSREADYTRKTQALAEERRTLETSAKEATQELERLAAVRGEYAQRLDALTQALKDANPDPDWDRLKAEDPIAFAKTFAEWQLRKQQMDAVMAEQERVRGEQEQHAAQQRDAYIRDQQEKLLAQFPEWREPAKAKAAHDSIMAYAREAGFTPDELGQVYDARLVRLLHDAARYRALATQVQATPVPKAKGPAAAPVAPVQGTKRPVSDLTRARQRLAKTGKADDLAPIFLAHIQSETKREAHGVRDMAIFTGTQTRYDLVGIREDLSNDIYNIAPTDTPFISNIGRGSCDNTLTEWQTDTLAAATHNSVVEGDETGFSVPVSTIRVGNYCQISNKSAIVSGTAEKVNKAGRDSQMAYELSKRAKELKRDMELVMLYPQASNAGNTATARRLAPMLAWLKTNINNNGGTNPNWTSGVPTASRTDGTLRTFAESMLKDVIQKVWTAGGEAKILMLGADVKATFSTFGGVATKTFDWSKIAPTAIIGAADVYVGEFGNVLQVITNRFQRGRDGWVLDPSMASVLYLRPFQTVALAKTGDAEKRLLQVEYTLKVHNEAAHGLIADLQA